MEDWPIVLLSVVALIVGFLLLAGLFGTDALWQHVESWWNAW